MSVVCRFRVTQKAELEHYEKGSAFQIKMAGAKSEPFGSATPAANCEMLIVPEAAAQEFKVGKFYLVHFELDPNQEPG
jgi:hypothetical protein